MGKIANNTALIISICVVIGIFLIVGSLNWILAAIYKRDNQPHYYDVFKRYVGRYEKKQNKKAKKSK